MKQLKRFRKRQIVRIVDRPEHDGGRCVCGNAVTIVRARICLRYGSKLVVNLCAICKQCVLIPIRLDENPRPYGFRNTKDFREYLHTLQAQMAENALRNS